MVRRLLCALLLVGSVSLAAQVANPAKVSYTPSPDHNTTLADGTVVVSGYQLDTYGWNGSLGVLVFTVTLPKVAPDTTNTIVQPVAQFTTLAINKSYASTLKAVGPGGASAAIGPVPFAVVGPPGPPANLNVKP